MVTVGQVMALVEELAPPALAEEWDRIGLQVGDPRERVEGVLVSLGLSPEVLREAKVRGCDLVICHHPLIFRPLGEVRFDRPVGALLRQAVASNIAVGVAHTNLDRAPGGLNDWLAEALGLQDTTVLAEAAELPPERGGAAAMGRMGRLRRRMPLGAWAVEVGRRLGVPAVRYVGAEDTPVERVACVGGAGADAIAAAAKAEADCLVTGDVKFHEALEALDLGLALVDPGHFGSEILMARQLARYLEGEARRRGWPLQVWAASGERDPFRFQWTGPAR